jgi:RNA polymerase sigma-70 factor (ECF subfamily)
MAAFEEICAAKRRELYFTAYAMLGSREDAEDAVQDAMISMFRYIGNLKKPEAISIWMHKILRISCVDIIRKNENRAPTATLSEKVMETYAEKDIVGEPEKILGDKEIYEELYRGIRTLPAKSRETLVLYYFSEMKYRDIAKTTNTSVKTVSTNLIRARKQLKSYLKERCPEMVSLTSLLSAISVNVASGGAATAVGVGIKSSVVAGKGILSALSSTAAPLAMGTAGVAVAAVATYSLLDMPSYAIELSGDCECGHINPQGIEVTGIRAHDHVDAWELLAPDGAKIYTGDFDAVTNYVNGLEKMRRNGHYTLRCIITSKSGDRYMVFRDITIGNLAGDRVTV